MSLTHQMYLQCLREVSQFSAADFDSYRHPLIERLLDHAWRHVDYYGDRLKPLVSSRGLDIDRWPELPLLRAREVGALNARLVARNVPNDASEDEAVVQNALVPVPRRSAIGRIAAECAREFVLESVGINSSDGLAIIHPDHAALPNEGDGWSVTFPNSRWVRADDGESPEALADWLDKSGCVRLRTTSRIAAALTEMNGPKRLETIIIVDDELNHELQERIAERFGSRVALVVERPVLGPVAASWSNDSAYTPSANMIVEVVDSEGKPVGAGQEGELVVTPLYEYACPLLRFAAGLRVLAADEPPVLMGVRRLGGIVGPVSL